MTFQLYLARPRGFCAGVDRAIEVVRETLRQYGSPVFVRHAIVHNRHVVEELEREGAVFVEDTGQIPEGSVAIFSAHGVSPQVRVEAEKRGLRAIDATCPLVTKVHLEARRFAEKGYSILLIGHRGHVEVEGTLGEAPDHILLIETGEDAERIEVPDPEKVALITQTTLSVDDTREIAEVLKARFPQIHIPSAKDICYATQNRQDAVKALCKKVEAVIVIGSPASSNSNRLREVAEGAGRRAWLIEEANQINPRWLEGISRLGVTSGASTPESLVQAVISRLSELGAESVVELEGEIETIRFQLPRELQK